MREGTTFEEAVRMLDSIGSGFLPVVDVDGKLIGIITDGDIRRAILNDKRSLTDVINYHPIVAAAGTPHIEIEKTLYRLRRRHMPVVDSNGVFLEVVILNDFTERTIENRVVIMAGGLGTRLGSLTRDLPKPMLNVNGKPILLHLVEAFKKQGFKNFIFCLNYKSDVIKEFFGTGADFGVNVSYTVETKRLGTAGALSLAAQELLEDDFLVTNGDILTSFNYEFLLDSHKKNNAVATMCVRPHSFQLPYANVITDADGNLISLEEKPEIPFFINAGIYALNPLVLDYIPRDEYFDMTSLFHALVSHQRRVKTYKMDDFWLDIGSPADFSKANNLNQIQR